MIGGEGVMGGGRVCTESPGVGSIKGLLYELSRQYYNVMDTHHILNSR